mmetsp:Transcript_10195/g.36281  ORF Transcript_10195/g.36281 Transcript_10195/m.36281 type:complete len:232 (-) Transcript_10195:704-1399(-)
MNVIFLLRGNRSKAFAHCCRVIAVIRKGSRASLTFFRGYPSAYCSSSRDSISFLIFRVSDDALELSAPLASSLATLASRSSKRDRTAALAPSPPPPSARWTLPLSLHSRARWSCAVRRDRSPNASISLKTLVASSASPWEAQSLSTLSYDSASGSSPKSSRQRSMDRTSMAGARLLWSSAQSRDAVYASGGFPASQSCRIEVETSSSSSSSSEEAEETRRRWPWWRTALMV